MLFSVFRAFIVILLSVLVLAHIAGISSLKGREEVPFCTCGHCSLSQNSIPNSQSHVLLPPVAGKLKAQMFQTLSQFKFHVWPSFHQCDTRLNIMKKEVMRIFLLFLLARLTLKVFGWVTSPVLILWALRAKCEASIFCWSGLNNCGPRPTVPQGMLFPQCPDPLCPEGHFIPAWDDQKGDKVQALLLSWGL